MTLSELGAKLRQAREEREMSVSDVVDRLKIPLRILQGVEEGSNSVPKTVYILHFIKEYARLLGFGEEEISLWLKDLEGFESAVFHPGEGRVPYTPVKPSLLPVLLGALFKVILIGALAFGAYEAYIYFFASRTSERAPLPAHSSVEQSTAPWSGPAPSAPAKEVPSPKVSQAEPSLPLPASPKENETSTVPAAPSLPTEATSPAETERMGETLAPEAPTENVSSVGETTEESAEPAQTLSPEPSALTEPAPALPEGIHQVEVVAVDGDCWMGFEPDGKHQQRTLRRGDTFSMTFRESLVLRLGNIRAVLIRYDGKELERSTSTRVETLTFPPQP